jgi:hypothetical protein
LIQAGDFFSPDPLGVPAGGGFLFTAATSPPLGAASASCDHGPEVERTRRTLGARAFKRLALAVQGRASPADRGPQAVLGCCGLARVRAGFLGGAVRASRAGGNLEPLEPCHHGAVRGPDLPLPRVRGMARHGAGDRGMVAPVGGSRAPAATVHEAEGIRGAVGAIHVHRGSLPAARQDSSGKILIRCCLTGGTGPQ